MRRFTPLPRLGMLACLLGLYLCCETAFAEDVPYDLRVFQANRAYAEQRYEAALAQYTELLRTQPGGEATDVIHLHRALCHLALNKGEDAITSLEALRADCPQSPLLLDALVLLHRLYRERGTTARAQAVWEQVAARWPESPQMWQLIGEACREMAQQPTVPVSQLVEWIAPLQIAVPTLSALVYAPLLRAGRVTEAKAVQEGLHAALAARGATRAQLEDARRAYHESVTKQAMAVMYRYFMTALEADDLDTARTWLANMNTVAPEYPLAMRARKQYRETMAPPADTAAPDARGEGEGRE